MSRNKDTIREFMAAFSVTDRERILAVLFCDVFEMRSALIHRLTSYLAENPAESTPRP